MWLMCLHIECQLLGLYVAAIDWELKPVDGHAQLYYKKTENVLYAIPGGENVFYHHDSSLRKHS